MKNKNVTLEFTYFLLSANARRCIEGITGQSLILFTSISPVQNLGPTPVKLKKILDMAPITVTDQTPMETVVDMFRKLGLRQILVTHNGYIYHFVSSVFIMASFYSFFFIRQAITWNHHKKRCLATCKTNG